MPIEDDLESAPQGDGEGRNGPVVQVLARVERKLDILVAALDRQEIADDRQWCALDLAGKPPGLGGLAASLTGLLERRTRLLQGSEAAGAEGEREIERSWDRLVALADELCAMRVTSVAGMRLKALALQELHEEESDDIVHRLAASLAVDLLPREPSA
jgi:hypothetical protein